jgi:hypothetical protein
VDGLIEPMQHLSEASTSVTLPFTVGVVKLSAQLCSEISRYNLRLDIVALDATTFLSRIRKKSNDRH